MALPSALTAKGPIGGHPKAPLILKYLSLIAEQFSLVASVGLVRPSSLLYLISSRNALVCRPMASLSVSASSILLPE